MRVKVCIVLGAERKQPGLMVLTLTQTLNPNLGAGFVHRCITLGSIILCESVKRKQQKSSSYDVKGLADDANEGTYLIKKSTDASSALTDSFNAQCKNENKLYYNKFLIFTLYTKFTCSLNLFTTDIYLIIGYKRNN